jgi:hypothetical protein
MWEIRVDNAIEKDRTFFPLLPLCLPTSYKTGNGGLFPCGCSDGSPELTTVLYLVPKLRMCGDSTLLHPYVVTAWYLSTAENLHSCFNTVEEITTYKERKKYQT